MPQVSVVIPTKGRPDLLLRAVATALGQTLSDLEVIVVVDGDDPETTARLGSVADRRLKIIVNPTSLGPGLARNVGARSGAGRWVAFLDDDDEWSPKKLEKQLSLVSPDEMNVIVTCLALVITPFGQSVRPRKIYDNTVALSEWLFDRRTLAGGENFMQTSTILMPKPLFDKFQFRSSVEHEEWDLLFRVTTCGAKVVTAPDVLVRNYIDDCRRNLSKSQLEQALEWVTAERSTLLTPRAYSGYCLTVAAQHAKRRGGFGDFARLLWLACRYGSPTAIQLLVYFAVWVIPLSARRKIRRIVMSRQR